MGRKCAVPHCYTGYRKCKEKASLYKVPDDDFFLNKWQEAIAREDRPITPKDYVCEKHFKEDDIQRTRVIKNVVEVYLRPKLKPDAIPSIFPDLPEFILKMVKKRRKLLPQDLQKKISVEEAPLENSAIEDNIENKDESQENCPIKNENGVIEGTAITNNEIEIKSEIEETEKEQNLAEDLNRPKIYKCKECSYETKYPHNLLTHQSKHLTGEESYIRCDICPEFKTKWELTYRNHMKIKHGVGAQEIFSCTLCEYKTKVKVCLKRHIDRHNRSLSNIGKLRCEFPECHFACDSKALLKIHILVHKEDENEPKAFKCTECLYSTNSKTHILKHIKSAHSTGDDTVVCISTKKSDKTIQKKRRPKGKPLYRCVKCDFQTHYHSFLLKHIVKHRGESEDTAIISKVWKCSKCPYATFFQQALEEHQETDCETNNSTLNTMEVSNASDSEGNNQMEDNNESGSNNGDKIITPIEEVNCNSFGTNTTNYKKEEEDGKDYKEEEHSFECNNHERNTFDSSNKGQNACNKNYHNAFEHNNKGDTFDCNNEGNVSDFNNDEGGNVSDSNNEGGNTSDFDKENAFDSNRENENSVDCNVNDHGDECINEENNTECHNDNTADSSNTEENFTGYNNDKVDSLVCNNFEGKIHHKTEENIADCNIDKKIVNNYEEKMDVSYEDVPEENFEKVQTNLPEKEWQ